MKPLENMIVLDFSQYLAGPSAALRLADMGARVIKIERPGSGDGSRQMKLHNLDSMGDSGLFQTINRNKQSFCADLKSPEDMNMVKKLIRRSDVMIENFRPGVMKKIGLDYETVKSINPRMVYGTVTGYGATGPWNKKPGQDLLVQSISGLAWLNGDDGQPPMPFALSLADSYTGIHLAEGIMACLFRRFSTGLGGLVEVSLLESILDMQFEVITLLADNLQLTQNSINNVLTDYKRILFQISTDVTCMDNILELSKVSPDSAEYRRISESLETYIKANILMYPEIQALCVISTTGTPYIYVQKRQKTQPIIDYFEANKEELNQLLLSSTRSIIGSVHDGSPYYDPEHPVFFLGSRTIHYEKMKITGSILLFISPDKMNSAINNPDSQVYPFTDKLLVVGIQGIYTGS